jgi:hypothetical protein
MADITSRIGEMIRARGAEYERQVQNQHERELERKREARKRQTPEQRDRERARKQQVRKHQTPEQRERKREARKHQTTEQREREKERERRRSRKKLRPFMAIDGEGGGIDHLDCQNYLLMVASGETAGDERILHRDGKPLSVRDCLEFILSLPAEPILVGYGYAITYQQGQYFRVARVDRSTGKPGVLKGSTRTICETLGFFQCTFVKAIGNWTIGSDRERAIIAENKTRRHEFSQLTEGIIEYCELECRYLAMLMTEFRDVCTATGISAKEWRGAGWLAAALFEKHGVPKRPLMATEAAALAEKKPNKNPKPPPLRWPQRDQQFEMAANLGFYGGRFEVLPPGFMAGPLFEYDLRSAHGAAMLHLPCPLHTRWEHQPHSDHVPERGLYLAKISFSHPDGLWCGFPFSTERQVVLAVPGNGLVLVAGD